MACYKSRISILADIVPDIHDACKVLFKAVTDNLKP